MKAALLVFSLLGFVSAESQRLQDANAAFARGDCSLAVKLYEAYLLTSPVEDPAALSNLGSCQVELGQYEGALSSLQSALALEPPFASELNYNIGYVLLQLERSQEAIKFFEQSWSSQPDSPIAKEARIKHASTLMRLEQPSEAASVLQLAIEQYPSDAALRFYMGEALNAQKQFAAAAESYQLALERMPPLKSLITPPADVSTAQLASMRKLAIRVQSALADTHSNAGHQSTATMSRTVALVLQLQSATSGLPKPSTADSVTLAELMSICDRILSRLSDSRGRHRATTPLQLTPPSMLDCSSVPITANPPDWYFDVSTSIAALFVDLNELAFSEAADLWRIGSPLLCPIMSQKGRTESPISPYKSLYLPLSQSQRTQLASNWCAPLSAHSQSTYEPLNNVFIESTSVGYIGIEQGGRAWNLRRAVKIGIVSRRFEAYAGTRLMEDMLVRMCPGSSWCVLHCIATGVDDGSEIRERIASKCPNFYNFSLMGSETLASSIAEIGLDVLVDYDGAHDFNQLAALAKRPAPTIVTWLGFPSSTGCSKVIDYTLLDRVVFGESVDGTPIEVSIAGETWRTASTSSMAWSERVMMMPQRLGNPSISFSYQPQSDSIIRDSLQIPPTSLDSSVSFNLCAFHRMSKFESTLWSILRGALLSCDHCTLTMLSPVSSENDSEFSQLHDRIMNNLGIAQSNRLILVDQVPHDEHQARYKSCHLHIDSVFYGGHTTTADSLQNLVPVITTLLDDNVMSNRVSASLLTAIGMEEV